MSLVSKVYVKAFVSETTDKARLGSWEMTDLLGHC